MTIEAIREFIAPELRAVSALLAIDGAPVLEIVGAPGSLRGERADTALSTLLVGTWWTVLLLIGAYVGEVLSGEDTAPFVLVTASALAFVLIFLNLGVPPHSYRDLVGAVMVAGVTGPVGGWIFRVIADAQSFSGTTSSRLSGS